MEILRADFNRRVDRDRILAELPSGVGVSLGGQVLVRDIFEGFTATGVVANIRPEASSAQVDIDWATLRWPDEDPGLVEEEEAPLLEPLLLSIAEVSDTSSTLTHGVAQWVAELWPADDSQETEILEDPSDDPQAGQASNELVGAA